VDERRLGYHGWRVVGACGVGAFFATLPLNTFAVFLGPLCAEFSWSREAASSAFGVLTLMAAVSAPVVGRLLDRVGARRLIVPCLAISGAAVVVLSRLSGSLWELRTIFGVLGLLMMGASPIAYSRAIFGWFTELRGRALGAMLTGAGLSGIVLPPVTARLIGAVGWRAAWVALGLGTLLVAAPVTAAFVRDRARPGAGAAPVPGASAIEALRSRVFWTLTAVVFAGTMASNGVLVHVVALLGDRGVPAARAALVVSAMGGASLLGRLVTGWLLDRFEPARVSAALLTVAALGTFALSGARSLETAALAGLGIGFGAGGEVDVIPYLLARHFGARAQSTLYGLTWTAWGVSGALGPVVMGRAFDATGAYTTTLVEFGIVTLASAGLMLTLPARDSARESYR